MDKLKKYGKKKICAFLMAVIAVTGIAAASAMAAMTYSLGPYSVTDTYWYKYTAAILKTSTTSEVLNSNSNFVYYGAKSCAKQSENFSFKATVHFKSGNALFYRDKESKNVDSKINRIFAKQLTLDNNETADKWKLKLSTTNTIRDCYGDGWVATKVAYDLTE